MAATSVTEWMAETAMRHGRERPGVGRELVAESIRAGKFKPKQLNLAQLARKCFGQDPEARLKRFSRDAEWVGESTDAVDASAFKDIVGAVAVEAVTEGYVEVTSATAELVGTWEPGNKNPLDEATIPYRYQAVEPSQDVAQGQEYPRAGFAGYWIKAPVPQKHGLISVLTLEATMANDVQGFLDAKKEIGRVVGREEARKKLRVVLGITNNYNRKGTVYQTYQTAGAWVNAIDDFDISQGPIAFDRALQLFEKLLDPVTGEEVESEPTAVFTTFGNVFRLKQVTHATEVRQKTADGLTETIGGSPLGLDLPVYTDVKARRLLLGAGYTEAQVSNFTVIGDLKRAFRWRMVEPFSVYEVSASDEDWTPGWSQDIVYAVKARTWGCAFVYDPYCVIRLRKMA